MVPPSELGGTTVALFRPDQKAALVAALLVLVLAAGLGALRLHGRTGGLPIGPNGDTKEQAAELDREIQEIGQLIRERQDSAAAGQGVSAAAWPAPGVHEITSEFGTRLHPILQVEKLHAGIDIGAPSGWPVVASLGGKVIAVEELPAYGQIVVIDHGEGLATVYAHLLTVRVNEGEQVNRGTLIGRVGATGHVTGPHLHFEVRQDGEPVEPALVLK